MSFVNIRACDVNDDDPMKAILDNMNKSEEERVIASAKKTLEEGKATPIQVCTKLKEFMGLWNGTRKFHLIPQYIVSLK